MKYYETEKSLFRLDAKQNFCTWSNGWVDCNEYRNDIVHKILNGDAWLVSEDTLPVGAK